jgi:hypothetical protein
LKIHWRKATEDSKRQKKAQANLKAGHLKILIMRNKKNRK